MQLWILIIASLWSSMTLTRLSTLFHYWTSSSLKMSETKFLSPPAAFLLLSFWSYFLAQCFPLVVAYKIDLPRKRCSVCILFSYSAGISCQLSLFFPLYWLFSCITLPTPFHAFITPYLGYWIILLIGFPISNIINYPIHLITFNQKSSLNKTLIIGFLVIKFLDQCL